MPIIQICKWTIVGGIATLLALYPLYHIEGETIYYEKEKEVLDIGVYDHPVEQWTVSHIKRYIDSTAKNYNVSAYTMHAIIGCESGYDAKVQSKHTYSNDNARWGVQAGEQELSFGLVQIHLPDHPYVTKEQAINPEFAVKFLAENLQKGRATWWSCYNDMLQ